jgi:hypothetical protein
MAQERPEKQTVRGLWVEEVKRVDAVGGPDDVPLYLTTPGEYGLDIQALIDAGIIERTETQAVADPERLRVVALESSPIAYVAFCRRFPGVKAIQTDLKSLLQSESLFRWPGKDSRSVFRARVVNLDLNCALDATVESGQLAFPTLALVRKVGILHGEPNPLDWTLCLTLHGELNWDTAGAEKACRFLADNFGRDTTFADDACEALGKDLFDRILADPSAASKRSFSPAEQQAMLMVIVPKQIAFDAHKFGWSVDTVQNLRYGGGHGRGRMVTWVLRFSWDARCSTEADVVYREGLARALSQRGKIDTAGNLTRD